VIHERREILNHPRAENPEVKNGERYAEKYGRKDVVDRAFVSVHELDEREKKKDDS
jgi:hypothetical protein